MQIHCLLLLKILILGEKKESEHCVHSLDSFPLNCKITYLLCGMFCYPYCL